MDSAKPIYTAILTAGIVAVIAILQPVWLKKNDYTFSVSAEAKVAAVPDKGTLQFSVVVSKEKTSAEAADQGNEKMTAVIAAVKGAGVAEADIATSQYSVSPSYAYDRDKGTQTIDGYNATQTVTVTVRDVAKAGDVIAAAIAAGANQAGSLQLSVDDPDAALATARAEATTKAQAKANAVAKESGMRLGRLVNVQVTEGGSTPPPTLYAQMGLKDAAVSAPDIQPGTQEQTVGVTVTYLVK